MKNPATHCFRLHGLLYALLFSATAACTHSSHGTQTTSTPVYGETEPNGTSLNANYFGTVVPGDHFFIDGYLDGSEFDGFAFTSAGPVHVDFRLWVTDPNTDLDICIYDPQILPPGDPIVDCFQTANDPEEGGVDVDFGGLEFHLIVESFVGSGSYSLEISASPLYLARSASATASTTAIRGVHADAASATEGRQADPHAFDGYAARIEESTVHMTIIQSSIDPETGVASETFILVGTE